MLSAKSLDSHMYSVFTMENGTRWIVRRSDGLFEYEHGKVT